MAESKLQTLVGNDMADDYVRTYVPQGRWSDTWAIFKANFVKLVIINVLTLVFFVPGIALMYFRSAYVSNLAALYPFSSNAGIAIYTPSTIGLGERLVLSVDLIYYAVLIAAGFIASVGIAGAAYSIKKIINSHGEFSVKSYFHGVRRCYLNTVVPVTVFLAFYYFSVIISDWSAQTIAYGASAGGPITAKVFIIIATVLIGIYAMWVLAVGVSYKVKFHYLLKNSLVLLAGSVLQTVLMLGVALIPVWILMLGMASAIFTLIGAVIFLFFGISFILLVWMAYTQWMFDCFITPAIATEKQAKLEKMTPKQREEVKREEDMQAARELLAAGKSELVGKPIKPIGDEISVQEIPSTFGRGDVAKAQADRDAMNKGIEEYYEEHKNETKYVEYNKMFAEREKALPSTDKKGKKKKISADNLLK